MPCRASSTFEAVTASDCEVFVVIVEVNVIRYGFEESVKGTSGVHPSWSAEKRNDKSLRGKGSISKTLARGVNSATLQMATACIFHNMG